MGLRAWLKLLTTPAPVPLVPTCYHRWMVGTFDEYPPHEFTAFSRHPTKPIAVAYAREMNEHDAELLAPRPGRWLVVYDRDGTMLTYGEREEFERRARLARYRAENRPIEIIE